MILYRERTGEYVGLNVPSTSYDTRAACCPFCIRVIPVKDGFILTRVRRLYVKPGQSTGEEYVKLKDIPRELRPLLGPFVGEPWDMLPYPTESEAETAARAMMRLASIAEPLENDTETDV